jgi:hypothetical protein
MICVYMLGIVSQSIVRWVKVLPCLIHWENGRCSLFLSMFAIASLTVSVYMCVAAWDRFPIHLSIGIKPCRVVSIGKAAGTYDYCSIACISLFTNVLSIWTSLYPPAWNEYITVAISNHSSGGKEGRLFIWLSLLFWPTHPLLWWELQLLRTVRCECGCTLGVTLAISARIYYHYGWGETYQPVSKLVWAGLKLLLAFQCQFLRHQEKADNG